MSKGFGSEAEGKINPFEERTKLTFERLRSGEINIDDMTLSELKSYFTGIGFFKQEEVIHYQLIMHEIKLRELYQRLADPKANTEKLQTSLQSNLGQFLTINNTSEEES